MKQLALFKSDEKAYGGSLQTTRKGRQQGRPLATKNTMHIVLRSTHAKGEWSFLKHSKAIRATFEKFAAKYGVRLISIANVGNHIHLHVKLANRYTYNPFIRAVTGAIAMKITGQSRWNKMPALKFWDRRPFSRVVIGCQGFLCVRDYLRINRLEGETGSRVHAELIFRSLRWDSTS